MNNIKHNQLKKCITLTVNEFKKIFVHIFEDNNNVDIEINAYEGIYFCGISAQEVYTKLSEYFDVNVTSVHIDQEDLTGVWICYK